MPRSAWDRLQEMKEAGTLPDPPSVSKATGKNPWYVAYWFNRPGQPLASKVVHVDRWCPSIRDMPAEYVREATEAERANMPVCQRRGGCGG